MAAITYTAKRKLSNSHISGVEYSFEVGLRSFDPAAKINKKTHESLSGASETWLASVADEATYVTDIIDGSESTYSQMWEFLASCAAGESFFIDEYGTIAVPADPREVILSIDTIAPLRIGSTQLFTFSFKVRDLI